MGILLAFAPFIVFATVDRLIGSTDGLHAGAVTSAALLVRNWLSPARRDIDDCTFRTKSVPLIVMKVATIIAKIKSTISRLVNSPPEGSSGLGHFFAFSPISVNADFFVAGSLADPAAVAVGDVARGFARGPGCAEPSAASCGSSQARLGRQSPAMCLLS